MSKIVIGLLGLGEVGSVVAEALLSRGHRVKAWDINFARPGSRASVNLASHPKLESVEAASQLASGCTVLISMVTAGNAKDAARSIIAGVDVETFYLDLNSVSPECKYEMAAMMASCGARFVEAAIMAPIHPKGMDAPVLLGGAW
ncbi:MAG: NAD(P)-binding domain-containing protein, partial [Pseudomonadales bacterium]